MQCRFPSTPKEKLPEFIPVGSIIHTSGAHYHTTNRRRRRTARRRGYTALRLAAARRSAAASEVQQSSAHYEQKVVAMCLINSGPLGACLEQLHWCHNKMWVNGHYPRIQTILRVENRPCRIPDGKEEARKRQHM